MIEDKLAEARFFLNKILEEDKKEKPNLSATAFYYSAFLSSSYSVFDYILYKANRVYNLGLQDEGHWDENKFLKEANEKNNKKAIDFANWFISRKKIENGLSIGKVFSGCRRINVHKRPTYKIDVDPRVITGPMETGPRGEIEYSIKVDPKISLKVEGFEHMKLIDACKAYYSTIEKVVNDANEKLN